MIAARWRPGNGTSLHNVQFAIARRGIQLLKKDGLMVYSTCSFDPIQNEAVVAELLRCNRGMLELVETKDLLPGLLRRQGLSTWRVMQMDHGAMMEVRRDDPACARVLNRFAKSVFPPSEEEAGWMHLERW